MPPERDPRKSIRNKEIKALTEKINEQLLNVLKLTGYPNMASINGVYGGKYATYIDIKNEVIDTSEQFIALYFQGFQRQLESLGAAAKPGGYIYDAFLKIKDHEEVRNWVLLFLKRTFFRNYEALSKVKPSVEESIVWIGQENASYGLLVTPRFQDGQWENDKSEIRHFKHQYWSIGHILETGLVIPFKEEKIDFHDIEQYLTFFKNVLVRNSGSSHEREIAERYCDFVRASDVPEKVSLLIPELRYGGISKKHLYRLDFTVINPFNMGKVGFELSPWSTHGMLSGTRGKTQKKINEEALANFEKEIKKLKSFFLNRGITVLIYTDTDLMDYDSIFEQIAKYLSPTQAPKQLLIQAR
jgi:hypothetical protein